MTEEQEERVAFAIYQQFIRHGAGSCMTRTVNGKQVPETPEEACVRRWRRLSDKTRNDFIAEARAAIRAFEDGL